MTTTAIGVNTASPGVALVLNTADGAQMPAGTTAQRPSAVNGLMRYNSDSAMMEFYVNGKWGQNSLKGVTMNVVNAHSGANYVITGYLPHNINVQSIVAFTSGGGAANVVIFWGAPSAIGVGASLSNVVANSTSTAPVTAIANNVIGAGNQIWAFVTTTGGLIVNNLVIALNYV
jgi:hypothetical protein